MAQIQGSGLTPSNQGVWGLQGNSGQNNWLGTSDNTDLIFKVNSQERLRLQTNGTITANGILHTNRLKVEGLTELDSVRTVHIRANRITSQNPGDTLLFFGDSTVVLDHSNNHIYTSYKLPAGESETDRSLRIQCQTAPSPTPAGWTNHTILNQIHGRVGIGTAIPQHKLHVNGNTVITGKLGVVTTSPQHRLDIRNTGGDYALRVQSDGTVIAGKLTGSGSSGRLCVGDANHYIKGAWGAGISLSTFGAVDALFVEEGSGHVGIGNLSPDAMLDVENDGNSAHTITARVPDANTNAVEVFTNGKKEFLVRGDGFVYAREINVQVDNLPDYVFKSDYNLMSLDDVESYVKRHSHLPDVPSAAEVDANGLNIGEMNSLLLKKVEELTLYLIEQNKMIQHLQDEVNQISETK